MVVRLVRSAERYRESGERDAEGFKEFAEDVIAEFAAMRISSYDPSLSRPRCGIALSFR